MAGDSTEMRGTARMKIQEGKLDEFKWLVEQCKEVVRTKDSGTLEYDFFLNAEGTECFVHERYRDSAAGLEHMVNIGPLAERLATVCSTTGEVCGNPSPQLRRELESAGVTIYAPLEAL